MYMPKATECVTNKGYQYEHLVLEILRLGVKNRPVAMTRVLDTPKRLQGFSQDLLSLHPESVFVNPVQRLNGSESVLLLFAAVPKSC